MERFCRTLNFFLLVVLVQNFGGSRVESASVRLYKEENHSGLLEELTFYHGTFCKNLTEAFENIESVDNSGNCFKLYDKLNCKGKSIKLSSREFAYNNLKNLQFANRALSIGLCSTVIDIYAGDNFTGSKARVKLLRPEDCVAIPKNFQSTPIKSIKTNGGCTILHDDPNCGGHSLKINAGPNSAGNLKAWDFRHNILSLSSCDEFDNSRGSLDEPIPYVLYDQFGSILNKDTPLKCGCHTLDSKRVTSVATNGHCVRLYAEDDCKGEMIEIQPDSLFKNDLGQVNFAKKASSVSTCEENSCTNEKPRDFVPSGPVFGEYLFDQQAVVIKLKGVPSHDHFCELTRRCIKNRQFDCEPFVNASHCHCTRNRKIMCDSMLVDPGNFVEEPEIGFPFPIVGQYNWENTNVCIVSSVYEAPGAPYCELVKRCTGDRGSKCDNLDKAGGRELQSLCDLESRKTLGVLGVSAGTLAREPPPIDEDDEFSE